MAIVLGVFGGVALVALAAFGTFALAFVRLRRPPSNSPTRFLSRPTATGRPVLVCAGDSITHGRASASFVDLLLKRLGSNWDVVNAGINADLAWNLRQRLDAVIACQPALVTVLIGTNDAVASLSEESAKRYREQKLPRLPDRSWYRENLQAVVQRLKAETKAKISLVTIPFIGVRRDDAAWAQASSFNEVVREVSQAEDVALIDLHAALVARLGTFDGTKSPPFDRLMPVMMGAILRRTILGWDFTRIGRANGFRLLADHLHLDEEGADLANELIFRWVESQSLSRATPAEH